MQIILSMSNCTIKPVLKKKFPTDKFGIINIRITQNRKSKYISLSVNLAEKYWNDNKGEVRANFENNDQINEQIQNKIKELTAIFEKTDDVDKVVATDKLNLVSTIISEKNKLEKLNRVSTAKRYNTTIIHIQNFLKKYNKKDIKFIDIDSDFICDFEMYLLTECYYKGKLMKRNSSKNYINTLKKIYTEKAKLRVFAPTCDPFILFVNKRDAVEQKSLTKFQVEKIISTELDAKLSTTRRYFLFQIFCQGLRVSDLMTLRWGTLNPNEGRINFFQFKGKKPHSILFNDFLIFTLKDFINKDCREITDKQYRVNIDGKNVNITYDEIKERLNDFKIRLTKELMKKAKGKDVAEKLSNVVSSKEFEPVKQMQEVVEKIKADIIYNLQIEIFKYARLHPNDFIFPFLKNDDFKDITFNESLMLDKARYNKLGVQEAMYNKALKKLQAECEIDVVLKSHLSRHTYTNIMLLHTDDVYAISKSLGHQNLKTTQTYLNRFAKDKVDMPNINLVKEFNF